MRRKAVSASRIACSAPWVLLQRRPVNRPFKFDALNRPEQTIPLHLWWFAEALVMQKIRLAFGRDSRT